MEEIYTVYVLYSAIFDKIYIGYTNNLIQRFQSHNQLGVKDWTKYSRGWYECIEISNLNLHKLKKWN